MLRLEYQPEKANYIVYYGDEAIGHWYPENNLAHHVMVGAVKVFNERDKLPYVEKEPGTQMPRGFKQGDSGDEDR